jgi:hypothetical protein
MPLFMSRHLSPNGCRVESFALIEVGDSVLARGAAQALGTAAPGAALADAVDPTTVPPEFIDVRTALADVLVRKPPALSVRRRGPMPVRHWAESGS